MLMSNGNEAARNGKNVNLDSDSFQKRDTLKNSTIATKVTQYQVLQRHTLNAISLAITLFGISTESMPQIFAGNQVRLATLGVFSLSVCDMCGRYWRLSSLCQRL